MTLPKQVVLDTVKAELFEFILKKQKEYRLTAFDSEQVLYQVLTDIKSDKEIQYADLILSMANQINQLEEDKKKMLQEKEIQTTTEKEK